MAQNFFSFFFFDICPLESCYAYISYTKNDAFGRHEKMKTVSIFPDVRPRQSRDNKYITQE